MIPLISVLYVDDEPALLELCKRYLEQTRRFTVTTASSAAEAFGLIRSDGIQAIVSDYQMPGMDGIGFLKQVRSTGNRTPFIMFTGKGREEVAVQAFENGADFYVQKGGAPGPQFAELMHKITVAVEHRQADAEVVALNRLYSVLSATNKAIVHIHTRKELLDEICRIVVNTGGFAMAWAGLLDPESHCIEPVGAAGIPEGFAGMADLCPGGTDGGQGPTGTAVRTGTSVVCNDIGHDPAMETVQGMALMRGYRSLAAVPFATGTGNAGVITCYSSEPGFFTARIVRLLDELSGDISFALRTLDHEAQRVAAERDLRQSELQYRRLFETAQDAILILDGGTGEVIDANAFILDMLGYPLAYFVGKHLWELGFIRDRSMAEHAFAELKTTGYIRYEDLPLERKDGQGVDVEFISNAYLVGDRKIIQCNIRDITARKHSEAALALAVRKLSLLSSITRHDIRNQVHALEGFLDLSKAVLGDPARLSGYIAKEEKIAGTIARQIEFTADYQDLGMKAPFWQDVGTVVGRVVAQLPVGDIAVDVPGPGLEVFADPLLEKVFFNLIDNACRYGGEKMTSIRVHSREEDGALVITVEDDGSGVSAEDKTRLFTKGFGRHTGLGLYLSREILSITGITITETGTPGSGARFEMTVPGRGFRFTGMHIPE